MSLYIIGIISVAIAFIFGVYASQGVGMDLTDRHIVESLLVFAGVILCAAVLSSIWRRGSVLAAAGKARKIAAKGANDMDTRKDGFIDDVVDVLARKSGKLAAKGADHVETFKEAFKDGRRK